MSGLAKLTDARREELRRRAKAGEDLGRLAAEFDVSRGWVSHIKNDRDRVYGKKQQALRNPGFFNAVRRDRVLPQFDPSEPLVSCERMTARLRASACAARSEIADRGDREAVYAICKGCKAGQKRRKELGT